MKTIFNTLFCLFFALQINAQYTIQGTVIDETGELLIGVSIQIKDTQKGTITDYDGSYKLGVDTNDLTLIFSYVGFGDVVHELKLKDAITVLDVELKEGAIISCWFGPPAIDSYSTYTESTIKSDKLPAGHYTDPLQLLRNKVPSFQINQVGNDPNENNTLRLRGIGDYYNNSAPLTVVDGIPNVPLSLLDFRDISEFKIARDAGAEARLGGAATNGIIEANTFRPTYSLKEISYENYIATESIAQQLPVASAAEYASLKGINNGANTDWQDAISRRAWSHGHRLGMSSTNNHFWINSSLHYRDAQGVGLSSDVQSMGGRLGIGKEFWDSKIVLEATIYLNHRKRNFGIREAFAFAINYDPTTPIYDANSTEFGGYFETQSPNAYNPLSAAEQNTRRGRQTDFMAKISGQYMFNNTFDIKVNAAKYQQKSLFGEFYAGTSNYYGRPFNGITEGVLAQNHLLYYDAGLYYEEYLQDNWRLKANSILQQTSYHIATQISTAADVGDVSPNLTDLATLVNIEELGVPLKKSTTSPASVNHFRLSHANYFLLEGTLRVEDWTKKGGLSTSIGAGIDLKKWTDADIWLKGSYGRSNRADYARERLLSGGTDYYVATYSPFPNQEERIDGLQKNEGWNVGTTTKFWEHKLALNVNYFNQTMRDFYMPLEHITTLGISSELERVGDLQIRNQGIEAELNGFFNKEKWTWRPHLLFSKTQSKSEKVSLTEGLTSAYNQQAIDPLDDVNSILFYSTNPTETGFAGQTITPLYADEEMGQIIGYQTNGKDADGNWLIKDTDENGLINENDRTTIGNAIPNFTLQFGQELIYENWSFTFHMRGVFGHDILNVNRLFYERIDANTATNILQTENDEAQTGSNELVYDYYVEDASHIALDDVTLSYEHRFEKQRLVFYLTAQNILLYNNYSGDDPTPRYNGQRTNANNRQANPWAMGLDYRAYYPRTIGLSFGAKWSL